MMHQVGRPSCCCCCCCGLEVSFGRGFVVVCPWVEDKVVCCEGRYRNPGGKRSLRFRVSETKILHITKQVPVLCRARGVSNPRLRENKFCS